MNERALPIVVAGHICLDIIPDIRVQPAVRSEFLVPGKLVDVGPAMLATGGAVSNTGLALHRLGLPVKLMGKVGDDLFGGAIVDLLSRHSPEIADGMIVAKGEQTSYTIVINPPGVDRIFLHCTGTNDTLTAQDFSGLSATGAKIFHFGYPPLMRAMYENDGEGLVRLLAGVKAEGMIASLDMAKPDPASPAGRADWRLILKRALPYVDLFLPSFEEILYMLNPNLYADMMERQGSEDLLPQVTSEILTSISDELLNMGVAIVGIKLGEYGLYVRTSPNPERLRAMNGWASSEETIVSWTGRELVAPCFQVRVAGTTGAGDCTIAGLLASFAQEEPIERALLAAVGVGACNAERADAVSGIRPWDEIQRRIEGGWEQRNVHPNVAAEFSKRSEDGLWER